MRNNFYQEIIERKEPYIIADIGANHNGDIELAKKMVDKLSKLGCDAAKFQSWSKKSLFVMSFYKERSSFSDERFGTLEQMVEKFALSQDDLITLSEHCRTRHITFCSSAFSPEEVDLLDELNVPFFKVASMDLNNLPFLKYIAKKKKPIVLSTGMGSLAEIETSLNEIYKTGNREVVLLHCVSIYPPDDRIINLRNIIMLGNVFKVPVGFSDHTIGISIPLAAIALGAKIIEKHFTLDKNLPGWDHAISANSKEMEIIIKEGKRIVNALGEYKRVISNAEMEQRGLFRRSIVAKRYIKKGEIIKEEDLDFKRPGTEIRPDELKYVIGRKVNRDIEEDEIIKWEYLF
ncbi:MAG: N-acetylneuraminate synthase family protein [Candidatus Marinimicrobia bacterium]|nr:N-acetylneuraminate synthase family protein [Candidatus Neomarinimicrobiota bacterium]